MTPVVIGVEDVREWYVDLSDTIARPVVLFPAQDPVLTEITEELTAGARSSEYLQQRELAWDRAKTRHGDNLWNGKVCTIRHAAVRDARLDISTGSCEYKDIVFKREIGADRLAQRFGPAAVDCHTFTAALPITADGRLIFGRVGSGTIQSEGLLDFVGGSLNLDEHPIRSIEDIRTVTAQELAQEIGLEVRASDCELLSVNFHGGCCYFLFLVSVDGTIPFRRNREVGSLVECQCGDIGRLGGLTADVDLMVSCMPEYKRRLEAKL